MGRARDVRRALGATPRLFARGAARSVLWRAAASPTTRGTARATAPPLPPPAPFRSEMDVNAIIDKLLDVRGARPGKVVNLAEGEIRALCIR